MDLLGCVHPRGTITSQLLDQLCPFTVGQDFFSGCLCCQVQLTSSEVSRNSAGSKEFHLL